MLQLYISCSISMIFLGIASIYFITNVYRFDWTLGFWHKGISKQQSPPQYDIAPVKDDNIRSLIGFMNTQKIFILNKNHSRMS